MAVVNEFSLPNAPVPSGVDHVTLLWFVALDPAVIFTAPKLEQVATAMPASAVGGGDIVSVLVDVATAAEQAPLPLAVNTSVMLPAAISAALGV